jgi:hypothetical protein
MEDREQRHKASKSRKEREGIRIYHIRPFPVPRLGCSKRDQRREADG